MSTILAWYSLLFYGAILGAPIAIGVWAWKRRDRAWRALRDWYMTADAPVAPQIAISANATAQQINQPVIVVETVNGKPTVVGRRETDADGAIRLIPLQREADWRETVCPTDAKRWRESRHLMLVGETSSGKTTLARWVIARAASMATLIVLDPHAAPDDWHGVQVVGAGRQYDAINDLLAQLTDELDRRYQRRAAGDQTDPPLLICVDEVPAIAAHCTAWPKFMAELSNEGRKVGMRLCILTQGRLVKMLNIEGRSDLRSNFAEVLLGVKAVAAMPNFQFGANRPAALDLGGDRLQAIDLSRIVDETNAIGETGSRSGAGPFWPSGTGTGTSSQVVPSGSNAPEPLEPIIRNMAEEGMSRNQMARIIGGRKQDALDAIRRVLGEKEEA